MSDTPRMSRRRLLGAAGALAAAAGIPAVARALDGGHHDPSRPPLPPPPTRPRNRQPNIVLLLADDLGYGEVGCYGQRKIRTPNLDRLATEGTRFTQFYAGGAECAPSRCALMTGKHTGHASLRSNADVDFGPDPDEPFLGETLQAAGYRTALIGKWGLGRSYQAGSSISPWRKGFDEFYGFYGDDEAHEYYPPYVWDGERRVTVPQNVGGLRGAYAPDLFAQRAEQFLRANRDHPFFLLYATTLPHAPNVAPDDGPYATEPWPPAERAHAAQITRFDDEVGRLRALLQELGLADDTIILVTSDNGPHEEGGGAPYVTSGAEDPRFFNSSGGLRGIKRNLYEGGIRVPMITFVPDGPRGRTDPHAWAMWDLFPTIAELAGAKAPDGLDGRSVAPALHGGPVADSPYLYWETYNGWHAPRAWPIVYPLMAAAEHGKVPAFAQAARVGRWKGLRRDWAGPVEVYDLATDPDETTDVAATHPNVAAGMLKIFAAAHEETPRHLGRTQLTLRTQPAVPRRRHARLELVAEVRNRSADPLVGKLAVGDATRRFALRRTATVPVRLRPHHEALEVDATYRDGPGPELRYDVLTRHDILASWDFVTNPFPRGWLLDRRDWRMPLVFQSPRLSLDASHGLVVEVAMDSSTEAERLSLWWADVLHPRCVPPRWVASTVAPGPHTYRLIVPPQVWPVTAIRIAPLNRPGTVAVEAIRVYRDRAGRHARVARRP